MAALVFILLSTIIVSLLSFSGVLILFSKKVLEKNVILLVSFAVGALLGGAFLHLIPESLTLNGVFVYVLLGILLFFVLEKYLYWRHCHEPRCKTHPFTYLNLVGDGVHNFIDGMIISATFLTNTSLGWATTLSVIFHEIPQEIGDFAVLIYGGMKKGKALLLNFITALTCIVGAISVYVFHSFFEGFILPLLPFAAGGFIYIAMSGLIPELHKKRTIKNSLLQLLFLMMGLGFMAFLKAF